MIPVSFSFFLYFVVVAVVIILCYYQLFQSYFIILFYLFIFFMKIIFIFSCCGMFRHVPCSWFYRRPSVLANETLSVSLCHEIDNVFGTIQTCFDHVLSKFSGFSWERILFLNSACVNMVMQI